MTKSPTIQIVAGEDEITFSKLFNAPRQLVFDMFCKPEHLTQWWGPKDWKVSDCVIDFRPGGHWSYRLNGANSQKIWVKAVYQEIIEPELIVYTDGFVDPEGNPTAGLPQGITTVKFTDQDGKTRLTSHVAYVSAQDLTRAQTLGMVEGVTQSWDFLEEQLQRLVKP